MLCDCVVFALDLFLAAVAVCDAPCFVSASACFLIDT